MFNEFSRVMKEIFVRIGDECESLEDWKLPTHFFIKKLFHFVMSFDLV